MISMILTIGSNGVVGHNNGLPWMIPEIAQDIKGFVQECDVIMGSNTFEFMGNKPFPGASKTYVLSRRAKTPRIKNVSFIKNAHGIPHKGKLDKYVLGGVETFNTFRPIVNSRFMVYNLEKDFEGELRLPWVEDMLERGPVVYQKTDYEIDIVTGDVVTFEKTLVDYVLG